MKLYTEEQVKEAFKMGHEHGTNWIHPNLHHSMKRLSPIELPSDEEIEKIAEKESEVQGWGKYDGTSEQYGIKQAFINGVKLIFNQNK